MRDRIAKSVFWIAWSRGVIQALSFVSVILIARWLQPSDYGLMAMATVWTAVISLLAELGLGAAIVQFRDLDEPELNACFWLTLGIAGAGYLLLYSAATTIADWLDTPDLASVLRVAGLTLPLVAIRMVPDSLLRKRLALHKISQAEIVSAFVAIPTTLGLAKAGAGVWALVTGSLVQSSAVALALFWLTRWRPGLKMASNRLPAIIHFSLAILGNRVCFAAYQQADNLILGKVSGEVGLGMYAMAKQIAILPVTKVSVVVNQLALPVMAELQTDLNAMRKALLRGIRIVSCVTFPLCIGLLLVSEDFVLGVLTDKWAHAVPILQILCLYAVIKSIDTLLPPVLTARYRARFLFGYTAMLLAVMPVAFLGGALLWGGMGVAAAWVTAYPVMLVYLVREAFRELGISYSEAWHYLQDAVRLTMVMVIMVVGTQWLLWGWGEGGRVARLLVCILVGGVSYGTMLLVQGGPVARELKEIVHWMFRPKGVVAVGKQ